MTTMHLIVGLGNPGPRYSRTRHNAGFFVVDELAERWGVAWQRERQADVAKVAAGSAFAGVTLLKPRSYMNLSGGPVQARLTRSRQRLSELLVVHDDVDLPLGKLRFKQGGGAGGQRGVKDIIERLGGDFLRLKIGVGRPPAGRQTDEWVLGRFTADEEPLLGRVVTAAADAVELLAERGLDAAMNVTNGLDLSPQQPATEEPPPEDRPG